ncbi:MAG: hypothetical protein AAB495_02030 [Patescibacteria group bacterium]
MKSKKNILVGLCFLLGCFAISIGDAARQSLVRASGDEQVVSVLGLVILAVVGILLWLYSAGDYLFAGCELTDILTITASGGCLIIFSFLFGIGAAPFTRFGFMPWTWATPWDFLLILGLVPMIFVVHDLIVDSKKR